jgi:hypothetical protein
MKVPLDRKTVSSAFSLAYEAERSIHRALDPATTWTDFQNYYTLAKRQRIGDLLSGLRSQVPHCGGYLSHGMKETILNAIHPPGFLAGLLGQCSARWRTSWSFSAAEVQLIIATWQSFLRLLESATKPDGDALIGMRKDFCACGFLLAWRCRGMKEINDSPSVPHFHQTPWLNTVGRKDPPKGAA